MKNKLFLMTFVLTTSFVANADFAEDLLKASDLGRGGVQDGLSWDIELKNTEEGETTERTFHVRAKDPDALVEALLPARNKGEVFLFNDRNMWFYKPGLKKPVSISSRQKLTGQAANGDIASTHYARDYKATLEKSEIINGEKFHVLLLKAKAENLTYDQIRYWISDSSRLARKAEFLTLQGTPFKRAELDYENSILFAGKKVPFVSELRITDAKFSENKSILKYKNPKIEALSTSIFNLNRLSR